MLEEHLYMLSISEDQGYVVVALIGWVLAHMPRRGRTSIYCFPTSFHSIRGDCPSNSRLALLVHHCALLTHLLYPVGEDLALEINGYRRGDICLLARVGRWTPFSAHCKRLPKPFHQRQRDTGNGTNAKNTVTKLLLKKYPYEKVLFVITWKKLHKVISTTFIYLTNLELVSPL